MSFRRLAQVTGRVLVRALGERDAAGDLSISHSVTPGGTFTTLEGVFKDQHDDADLDLTQGISTVAPSVACMIEDLVALLAYPPTGDHRVMIQRPQGDPLGAGPQTFRIADHQPDGEGFVRLYLSKVPNGS